MNRSRLRVYAERAFQRRAIRIVPMLHADDNHVSYGSLVMRTQDPIMIPPDEAGFYIDEEDAAVLMDQLWDCGVRPTATKDRSEVVDAMKGHIDSLKVEASNLLTIIGTLMGKMK